jgi:hypothetical protein
MNDELYKSEKTRFTKEKPGLFGLKDYSGDSI